MIGLKAKPCPLCGEIPEVTSSYSCVYESIYGTAECKCRITIHGRFFNTYRYEPFTQEEVQRMHAEAKETAVENWNAYIKDVARVVKCKDCKHYVRRSLEDDDYYCADKHTQTLYSPDKDDFCSRGERK